jgi:hypothetical protein
MLEVISGLVVFTALCFAIKALRLYGVASLSILAILFPVAVLVLALVGGAAYLLFRSRSN